jgi:hypothetical protein
LHEKDVNKTAFLKLGIYCAGMIWTSGSYRNATWNHAAGHSKNLTPPEENSRATVQYSILKSIGKICQLALSFKIFPKQLYVYRQKLNFFL